MLVAIGIQHRGHVRVQVLVPSAVAAMAADEREGRTDRLAVSVCRGGVSAGMHQRPHQVSRHLRRAVGRGPHRVEDAAGIVEFTKVDEGAHLDAGPLLGPAEIALR